MQRHAVFQQIDQLRVVVVEMIQHVIDLFPHSFDLFAVYFQIAADDGKGLLQKCFFLPAGRAMYIALFLLTHWDLLPLCFWLRETLLKVIIKSIQENEKNTRLFFSFLVKCYIGSCLKKATVYR